jgi:hypothetical protein
MWPVDFKAVQRKIIEYGKKQKQRQQQQAQKEWEGLECVTGPRNNDNYDLPELLPPQSYAECQAAITSMQGKIHDLLSSPSRQRYTDVVKSTQVHLSRGAIHELEVLQARARATSHLKGKERARKSLNQGKSLTAIEALDSIIKKEREEADEELRKVSREARIDLNKKKNALRKRGVQARKDERERLRQLRSFPGGYIPIGTPNITTLLTQVRDPEKQPNKEDLESLKLHPGIDERLQAANKKKEKAYTLVYDDFLDYEISAETWEEERRRLCRPSLVIEVEQEIEQEMEDGLDEEQVEEVLSDVESEAESYMSNDGIVSQDDFVFF